jgi:serine protease Do
LSHLLDQFVCVRVVQGWGLDLSLFQFDGDMTFVAFFLNADRTIYGRYGTKHARDLSLEGLNRAMLVALALHEAHPKEKAALAKKTGPAPPWKTPEAMPALQKKHKQGDVSSYGCIHCHTIREGEMISRWKGGEWLRDRMLWQYPLPNALGLDLDPKDAQTVRAVADGSAAHAAGFQAGDRVIRVDGQPIISVFDVQWVLHHAAEPGTVEFGILRKGQGMRLSLALAEGWRRRIGFHRNNTTSLLQFSIAGFFCDVLSAGEKQKRAIEDGSLALRVSYLPSAKDPDPNLNAVNAGLRTGDVIVQVDELRTKVTADEWLVYLLQKKQPGGMIDLTVLRNGATHPIRVPLPK